MKETSNRLAFWVCLGVLITSANPTMAADPAAGDQAARATANWKTNSNKLRQIALRMHNYEVRNRRYLARAISDKDGKPLLSWRVTILPFFDESDLYGQFHLDEPWDSEHNKALIPKIPEAYRKAGRANDGNTVFLVPIGKGLAFEGDKGIAADSIAHGTIVVVEANDDRAIPWTKPDDLKVDHEKPLEGLGNAEAGARFGVAFYDGQTRGLSNQIKPTRLNALFMRSGDKPNVDELLDR